MNILLNNYCNLQCEYCFAKDVLEQDRATLSLEDFDYLLGFLEKSRQPNVRLLGGEPLLHPEFSEILNKIFKRKSMKNVVIFTNGVYIDRHIKEIAKLSAINNVSFTINFNNAEDIGQKSYDRMISNIKKLDKLKINLTLGINLYKENQNFLDVIKMSKELDLKTIRWSLTVPNTIESKQSNPSIYYRSRMKLLKDFFMTCAENNLQPHVDCNSIPTCMYDDDILRLITMMGGSQGSQNLRKSMCKPVVDVEPDLNAIRCFAFSDEKIDLKDFKDLQQLTQYFNITMEGGKKDNLLIPECVNCISYKMDGESCGCLAFRNIKI